MARNAGWRPGSRRRRALGRSPSSWPATAGPGRTRRRTRSSPRSWARPRRSARAAFLANLGDFAGPGTPERHEHYLGSSSDLPCPDICVVGNHDLDAPGRPGGVDGGPRAGGVQLRGGRTRFVALDAAPRGDAGRARRGRATEALAFLDATLPPRTSRTGSCSCTARRTPAAASRRTRSGASPHASGSSSACCASIASGWSAARTRCSSTRGCRTGPGSSSRAAAGRRCARTSAGCARRATGCPPTAARSSTRCAHGRRGRRGRGRVLQAFDAPGRARIAFGELQPFGCVTLPGMRVLALYDIHGNVDALEAVLADPAAGGPDAVLVGGDAVPGPVRGRGARPARRDRARRCACCAGTGSARWPRPSARRRPPATTSPR